MLFRSTDLPRWTGSRLGSCCSGARTFHGYHVVLRRSRVLVLHTNGWLAYDIMDERFEAEGDWTVVPSDDAHFLVGTRHSTQGRLTRVGPDGPETIGRLADSFHDVRFQPGGRLVATVADTGVRLYDRESAEQLSFIPVPHEFDTQIRWSADGRRIVTFRLQLRPTSCDLGDGSLDGLQQVHRPIAVLQQPVSQDGQTDDPEALRDHPVPLVTQLVQNAWIDGSKKS